jgi:hypothetical protein
MYYYYLALVALTTSIIPFYLFHSNKDKINELYNSVKLQHKTVPKSLFHTTKIIIQSYTNSLFDKKDHAKIKIDKDKIIISYFFKNKKYKIPINSRKKPNNIISIKNENDEDITDYILPFMGPSLDFHNQSIKPIDLNLNKMIINTITGQLIFNSNDYIRF